MNAPLTRAELTRADRYSRALAASTLTADQRRILATLDVRQILEVLGEIVQPSIVCPFSVLLDADDFCDALAPVERAYSEAFDALKAAADGVVDPDEAKWAEADFRYEMMRDRELGL